MTERSFTKRWLISLLGLLALGFAFPFMLGPLTYATGCGRVGGACGAVALVFGIFLRLPIVIGVGIYLAVLAWKRSRTLGLLPWGFVIVLLSYLSATPLLFGIGNFWAARFALGAHGGNAFSAFGFLFTGLIGLSFLRDDIGSSQNAARNITFAVGGVSLLVLLPSAMNGLEMIPFIGLAFLSIGRFINFLSYPLVHMFGPHSSFIVLAALIASLVWWMRSGNNAQTDVNGI